MRPSPVCNRRVTDRITTNPVEWAHFVCWKTSQGVEMRLSGCTLLLFTAMTASIPVLAQQKTGPGVPADSSLTWQGITLYGVVDVGLQYDTHMAPFTPYRPAASGNIVRNYSRSSVFGVTPSNMGQSRVGLQGIEPLFGEWSGIFQVETFFNPQSGEVTNAVKSLAVNNGRSLANQDVAVDGSSAGQAFQTAFAGLTSEHFGTVTFGRQVTLLQEGAIKYDPHYGASAFGLLGASNTYTGGGSNEDNRIDSALKYVLNYQNRVHVAGLYKFSNAGSRANSAVQANVGGSLGGLSVDAFYSKFNSAIVSASLTAAQVQQLPALGYSPSTALSATVSDNTAYSLMTSYKLDPIPVKLFAGYEYIKYANPEAPIGAGFTNFGGYVLAFTSNTAYTISKYLQVYWAGVRYNIIPSLELEAGYYDVHQDAYGSGKGVAGCKTSAHSTCSGDLTAISFAADYHFNVHFDAYAGAMYSDVDGGLSSGYLATTNINPTIGVRYKF
jgi:predicted porin